ncbi:MAG TPA: hypothetical protein ENJ50_05270 [Planctomycetaceae bacterium]|nr:hypothetical protein [Planctomycetaceae bacterium]
MDWWPEFATILADGDAFWRADLPRPVAHAAFAALSADPMTLAEWQLATGRYFTGASWRWPDPIPRPDVATLTERLLRSDVSEILVMDLPSRIVAASSPDRFPTCSSLPLIHDHVPTSQSLLYGLHPCWQVVFPDKALALWSDPDTKSRARQWAAHGRNRRRVLYEDVIDWIVARRCQDATIPSQQLHRNWLMTSHPGLAGRTPREVLFEELSVINRDLEYQQHAWVVRGGRPPGVPVDSEAYRASPPAHTELTIYHQLVRHLIEAYDETFGEASSGSDTPEEIQRRTSWLREERQRWWRKPLPGYDGEPPEALVDCERRRIPITMSPEKMADCECPICRAMADQGPMFVIVDSSPFEEEDFAFSLLEDEKEWREMRELWEDSHS